MKRPISLLAFSSAMALFVLFACSSKSSNSEKTNSTNDSVQAVTSVVNVDIGVKMQRNKTISLAFVGDVMMGTTFPTSSKNAYLPVNDGKNLFDNCRDIIAGADVAFANLEGALLDTEGKPKPGGRNPKLYYVFRMPTRYVNYLVDAGFDFAGIANNHINDLGPEGLNSTLNTLAKANIKTSGLRGRVEVSFGEYAGQTIGFAQFGHSTGTLSITDMDEVDRVVGTLKDSADIVVVTFHGGSEGQKCTHVTRKKEFFHGADRGNVHAFAHRAIDAGADIVVGHGPHVPRGMEIYKDRLIAYSLGNFCTPYRVNIQGISGYAPLLVAELNADGSFAAGRIHSFIQVRGNGPKVDSNNLVAGFISKLSKQDFPESKLQISADGMLSTK